MACFKTLTAFSLERSHVFVAFILLSFFISRKTKLQDKIYTSMFKAKKVAIIYSDSYLCFCEIFQLLPNRFKKRDLLLKVFNKKWRFHFILTDVQMQMKHLGGPGSQEVFVIIDKPLITLYYGKPILRGSDQKKCSHLTDF